MKRPETRISKLGHHSTILELQPSAADLATADVHIGSGEMLHWPPSTSHHVPSSDGTLHIKFQPMDHNLFYVSLCLTCILAYCRPGHGDCMVPMCILHAQILAVLEPQLGNCLHFASLHESYSINTYIGCPRGTEK